MTSTTQTTCETVNPRQVAQAAINIYETESAYAIHADVPGADAEAVQVHCENGKLIFQAQADDGWTWERTVSLPRSGDVEGIAAECANGVLRISVPKSAASRKRSISVSQG